MKGNTRFVLHLKDMKFFLIFPKCSTNFPNPKKNLLVFLLAWGGGGWGGATHFEKITHFEKFFQSVLYLGPT